MGYVTLETCSSATRFLMQLVISHLSSLSVFLSLSLSLSFSLSLCAQVQIDGTLPGAVQLLDCSMSAISGGTAIATDGKSALLVQNLRTDASVAHVVSPLHNIRGIDTYICCIHTCDIVCIRTVRSSRRSQLDKCGPEQVDRTLARSASGVVPLWAQGEA